MKLDIMELIINNMPSQTENQERIKLYMMMHKSRCTEFINIYQDRVNNNRFWLDCFETLKARGLKNILYLSVDDNKNMKRTAKIV